VYVITLAAVHDVIMGEFMKTKCSWCAGFFIFMNTCLWCQF